MAADSSYGMNQDEVKEGKFPQHAGKKTNKIL
jgi:hypothetical protein